MLYSRIHRTPLVDSEKESWNGNFWLGQASPCFAVAAIRYKIPEVGRLKLSRYGNFSAPHYRVSVAHWRLCAIGRGFNGGDNVCGQSDFHALSRRRRCCSLRRSLLLLSFHFHDRQRHCPVGTAHHQLQLRQRES